MRLSFKNSWYYLAAIILGIIALLIGLNFSNAQNSLLLNENIKAVATYLPLATFANNIAAASTIGCLVFAATIVPDRERILTGACISAMLWTISSLVVFFLTYIQVSNRPLETGESYTAGLGEFLLTIPTGQAWGVIVIIAALTSLTSLVAKKQTALFFTTLLAIAGLVPQALIGHASASSNHTIAVNALGLHIFGVSLWLGGLVALSLSLKGLENAQVIFKRFSSLALFAYILVFCSGIVSAWIRVGSLSAMNSPYGGLIIAKIVGTLLLGVAGFAMRRVIVAKTTDGTAKTKGSVLIAGELLIMGVVSGIAAALAASPPPVPQVLRPEATPAEILTGELLPPPLTSSQWFLQWRIDYLWLTIGLIMIISYLRGYFKVIRRGDHWPFMRPICWVIGWLLLFFFVSASPAVYGEILFSAHMVEHMALTMTIPLFLVMGAPVTMLLKSTEPRKDGSWGAREWVLWLVQSKYAATISHPLFAAVNFVASIIIFYYTPLFGLSLRTHIGHEFMIIHFMITGYLFVQSMVGIDPVHKRFPYPMRLITLLATMAFHAFFGVALMNSQALLQASWFGNMGRTWGGSALDDQHIGGAVAWGVGEIPTVVLAIMVAVAWAQSDNRETKRLDRAADRNHDAKLNAYNDMLKNMNQ